MSEITEWMRCPRCGVRVLKSSNKCSYCGKDPLVEGASKSVYDVYDE